MKLQQQNWNITSIEAMLENTNEEWTAGTTRNNNQWSHSIVRCLNGETYHLSTMDTLKVQIPLHNTTPDPDLSEVYNARPEFKLWTHNWQGTHNENRGH